MDEADLAQESENFHLELVVKTAKQRMQGLKPESARFCVDCEKPIPEMRRLAVPGCRRCVTCQAEIERGV